MSTTDDRSEQRRNTMVDHQIAARGVSDHAVLAAMRTVPREQFLDAELADVAYDDRPLPIEQGQTMSQPLIVAMMAEAAEIDSTSRVLEIGTGSGYGAAVLSCLAAFVWTVERIAGLADRARTCLAELGYDNVEVVLGDGSLGLRAKAPFDAIVVTAGSPAVPHSLTEQLSDGGRLVIPVGPERHSQHLVRVRRDGAQTSVEQLGAVRFVPLVGEEGWNESTR